jgi:flagellar biosynthesis regulator FlbT
MSSQNRVIFQKDFLSMTMGIRQVDLLREIFGEYRENLCNLLQELRNGKLVADKLHTEIHKLKSSSASVGALCLSDKLVEMERQILAGEDFYPLVAPVILVCEQTIAIITHHLDSLGGT